MCIISKKRLQAAHDINHLGVGVYRADVGGPYTVYIYIYILLSLRRSAATANIAQYPIGG